jgi:hypothetical protein
MGTVVRTSTSRDAYKLVTQDVAGTTGPELSIVAWATMARLSPTVVVGALGWSD